MLCSALLCSRTRVLAGACRLAGRAEGRTECVVHADEFGRRADDDRLGLRRRLRLDRVRREQLLQRLALGDQQHLHRLVQRLALRATSTARAHASYLFNLRLDTKQLKKTMSTEHLSDILCAKHTHTHRKSIYE